MAEVRENVNKASLRLECLKLAFSQSLRGAQYLEEAEKLYKWVTKSAENPATGEGAAAPKPRRGRKKKADKGNTVAPADGPKVDELFND